MVGVIAAIGIGFAVRRAGISGRSAGNSQILPGITGRRIGIDVPRGRIDQQAVALLIVTMASVGRCRSFNCWISCAPGVRRRVVQISLGNVSAAVTALASVHNDFSAGIVIDHDLRMPSARRAPRTDLRPRVCAGIVFPGIAAGGTACARETAVEQNAVNVRHINHSAFLPVAGIG